MAKNTEINLTESVAVILNGLKKREILLYKITTVKVRGYWLLLCFSV